MDIPLAYASMSLWLAIPIPGKGQNVIAQDTTIKFLTN